MAFRPFSVPLRDPLPSPPVSSLPDVPDPESNLVHAASPTVTRLLATVVTNPSFESTAASPLVAELVDFAVAYRLDYAASLVADSESVCPPSIGGECALGTDVLEDKQEDFECLTAAVPHLVAMLLAPKGDPDALDIPTPRSYAEAITGRYSSQWQTTMDAEMASWKSTGTYVDVVPPPGAKIVDVMWIFRVKRPSGSPLVFKDRYVAQGFNQRQGVDFFQTFSPTPKMTTLQILLHVAAQRDYELHSLDFSTAFLQGSLHEEIWLRRPPSFTRSFPAGTQWSLRRPVYGRCFCAPTLSCHRSTSSYHPGQSTTHHHPNSVTHGAPGPRFSASASGSPRHSPVLCLPVTRSQLHLRTSPILARYVAPRRHQPEHWEDAKRVLRYLCSAWGMGLVLGGLGPVVLTRHADASWVDDLAAQQSSQGYIFSLSSGSVSWRSTSLSSVFGSSCEAEMYAGAMAA
ncbi:unnamed protein product [Closterium sp. NIES-53]